jgi:hypothetical protein
MNQKTRDKQSIIVRGIAGAIQAMHTPTFETLKVLLNKFGWDLKRTPDDSTNKQTETSNE